MAPTKKKTQKKATKPKQPKVASASKKEEAEPSDEPQTGIESGKVQKIPLEAIDLEDTTFMFRAVIRVGDLKKSLEAEGLQIPIVVRRYLPMRRGKKKYQLISGFRRTAAAVALEWPEIAALDRTDLSDEKAFRAAVLENIARKTYSDIDRAYIIKAYKERGYDSKKVGVLMNLTKRQSNNLYSLLELPKAVQAAIDDDGQHFSTTHALTLKQMANKYSKLDMTTWVEVVNDEELSVSQLKRRVNKMHGAELATGFTGLFQDKGTNWRKGEVRFAPVKIKIGELSAPEKKKLKGELQRVLKKLG